MAVSVGCSLLLLLPLRLCEEYMRVHVCGNLVTEPSPKTSASS